MTQRPAEQVRRFTIGSKPEGWEAAKVDGREIAPGERVQTVELAPVEQLCRELVEWFDMRFPKGGKSLPGPPLYSLAEQARALLTALQPASPNLKGDSDGK